MLKCAPLPTKTPSFRRQRIRRSARKPLATHRPSHSCNLRNPAPASSPPSARSSRWSSSSFVGRFTLTRIRTRAAVSSWSNTAVPQRGRGDEAKPGTPPRRSTCESLHSLPLSPRDASFYDFVLIIWADRSMWWCKVTLTVGLSTLSTKTWRNFNSVQSFVPFCQHRGIKKQFNRFPTFTQYFPTSSATLCTMCQQF